MPRPFSSHLRGPFRMERFANSDLPMAQHQMLDGYICNGEFGVDTLLETVTRLQQEYPGTHLLASLDDFQASYTSGHAFQTYSLWDAEGQDLSHLPKSCFDQAGEYLGNLHTPEEFSIVEYNFRKQIKPISFEGIRARLRDNATYFDDKLYWEDCERMSERLDGEARILPVPVAYAYETIIAFPNGYFHGDLTPFENFEVARHLEEQFGLRLFGIGSAYLAFAPNRALTGEEIEQIADLFKRAGDRPFEQQLAKWIEQHGYVLIWYCGS